MTATRDVASPTDADTEPIPLFDSDSHVSEPPDLWTSRLGEAMVEKGIPRIVTRPGEVPRWMVGKHALSPEGKFASAGWTDYPPSHPPSLAEADAASFDPTERLRRMDEYGVQAQVLYPNIIAFSTWAFMELGPDLSRACVEAYNDFLVDFASEDPSRLVPLMMLPFWDIAQSVEELERCVKKGHRGVLLAAHFDKIGMPNLSDARWAPVLEAAEHHELSINFHIGFGNANEEDLKAVHTTPGDEHTRLTSISMLNNAKAIVDVICTGLCHRYPKLNFVSVESGAGWFQYVLESLDWHWQNFGAKRDRPELELPSFYFKRQIYGSFWFEEESLRRVADLFPDNLMFETDFPHPTSLSPGPASIAETPRVQADRAVAGLPRDLARKLLYDNAARLYHTP